MNILHIITGLNDGGAEGVLYRLCVHDRKNSHSIISLMDEGKYGELLKNAGVNVYCLGMKRGGVSMKGLFRLRQLIRAQCPDVVQTWMYHADFLGGIAARFAGVKAIVWGIRHSDFESGKSSRSTIMIAQFSAWLSRFIPRRIAVCAHKAAQVHADLGYEANKMVVISNGYDLSRFEPKHNDGAELRQAWGIQDGTPLIGMVARYNPQKDHATLIHALAFIHQQGFDFRAVCIGTGMDVSNKTVVEQLAQFGLTDRFLLLGARSDIPEVMNALDIHVLSSSFGEAFPNVLAEAMACGTPCVTTNVGDAAFIVGDMGWVVPPRDSRALGMALVEAVEGWRDRSSWSEKQRMVRERIVEHFSIERMIENYHSVWVEAIQASKS